MEQAKSTSTPDAHAGVGGPDAATIARGHETTDASVRGIVIFITVMFVASAAIIVLVLWMRDAFQEANRLQETSQSPLADLREPPPGPPLQPSRAHPTMPFEDTRQMNEANRKTLAGYGWVDEKAGIARVSIKRAMAIVAERGLPATLPPLSPPVAPNSSSASAPGPASAPASAPASTTSPARAAAAAPGAGANQGGKP